MQTELSIEFFPPQTPEGAAKLQAERARLAELKPTFFSVTYGAGGSTQARTFATVKEIAAEVAAETRCTIREMEGGLDHFHLLVDCDPQFGIHRFVKAVKGPMPWVKIMPTGGVDPDEASIAKWFGAGIVAAGMGSKLVTDAAVKAGDWAAIESSVREAVQAVAAFRASKA